MSEPWDTLLAQASKTLTLRVPGHTDPHRYALDRALRLVRTIDALSENLLEKDRPARVDLVRIAALYSCIPFAAPPGARAEDDGSELAADQLKEKIPSADIDTVLKILREHRHRATNSAEARLLADALTLEEIGLVGVWNQTRNFHAAGKTLDQLLRLWKTQHDYGYWETRIREGLHFDASRRTAERRLSALHTIFDRLARENAAMDVG